MPPQRRYRNLLQLSLFSVALLFTTSLVAQEAQRVAVAPFAGYNGEVPDLIVSQIEKVARERLEADPKVSLATISTGETGVLGMSPAIAEAQRLYEAGRVAYVDQRYEEAAKNLEQALGYFENNVADIVDWTMVGDTIFRLSTARFLAGDKEGGKEMIGRLLVYDWDFQLSADEELPEEYRKAFTSTEKSLSNTSEGSLDSSALTSGTELWVDGELRGAAPMTIDGLKPGIHFVYLKKDDQTGGGLVTVEAKKAAKLNASLMAGSADGDPSAALVTAIQPGTVGDDARTAANKLASRSAVPFITTAIVFPVKEGWAVQALVFDTEVATVRKAEPVTFDKDLLSVNVDGYTLAANIREAIADSSSAEVIDGTATFSPDDYGKEDSSGAIANTDIDTGDTGTTGSSGTGDGSGTTVGGGTGGTGDSTITGFQDEESWYENPWIWTGVGVGVAAIAATVIVLSVDNGGEELSGFNATVRW